MLIFALIACRRKKKEPVNRSEPVKAIPPANVEDEAERENLLNYKVQGGVELDKVDTKLTQNNNKRRKSCLFSACLFSYFKSKFAHLLLSIIKSILPQFRLAD